MRRIEKESKYCTRMSTNLFLLANSNIAEDFGRIPCFEKTKQTSKRKTLKFLLVSYLFHIVDGGMFANVLHKSEKQIVFYRTTI